MDIVKLILTVIVVVFALRACNLATSDKDKAAWNKCRDDGGSAQYCFSGLK